MIGNQTKPSAVVCALVPAYNPGAFLEESVRSLLNQTRPPDRIVIIDDACTDGSIRLVEPLVAAGLVELIRNVSNRGKAESLNDAFVNVMADYFVIQDADDISLPQRIERQLSFMEERPELGCSSSFIDYISSTGRTLGTGRLDLLSPDVLEDYRRREEHFALFCPAAIIRAKVVKEGGLRFRGQFWPADDIDLWNRIAEAGWAVLAQPEVLVQYRVHGSSAVTSSFVRTRMQYEWLRACMAARRNGKAEPTHAEFTRFWKGKPLLERCNLFRKIQAKGLYRAAGFAFAEHQFARAVGKILTSLLLSPTYGIRRLLQQLQGRFK